MESFHRVLLLDAAVVDFATAGSQTGAQAASQAWALPRQQFSVKYVSSSFIVSKLAE
jgi:hypothetical protein